MTYLFKVYPPMCPYCGFIILSVANFRLQFNEKLVYVVKIIFVQYLFSHTLQIVEALGMLAFDSTCINRKNKTKNLAFEG